MKFASCFALSTAVAAVAIDTVATQGRAPTGWGHLWTGGNLITKGAMGFNWLDGADGLNDGKVATIRPWLDLIIRYHAGDNTIDPKLVTKAKDMREEMTKQELDRALKELEKVGIKLTYGQLSNLAAELFSDEDRIRPMYDETRTRPMY